MVQCIMCSCIFSDPYILKKVLQLQVSYSLNYFFMEKLEYEDDTIPHHVANFLRQRMNEKAIRAIDLEERKHMDNDEMWEIEKGQQFIWYNFLR